MSTTQLLLQMEGPRFEIEMKQAVRCVPVKVAMHTY